MRNRLLISTGRFGVLAGHQIRVARLYSASAKLVWLWRLVEKLSPRRRTSPAHTLRRRDYSKSRDRWARAAAPGESIDRIFVFSCFVRSGAQVVEAKGVIRTKLYYSLQRPN
jgi:hypothetical protein